MSVLKIKKSKMAQDTSQVAVLSAGMEQIKRAFGNKDWVKENGSIFEKVKIQTRLARYSGCPEITVKSVKSGRRFSFSLGELQTYCDVSQKDA